MTDPRPTHWQARAALAFTLAGAAVAVGAYPLYQLAMLIAYQLGPARTTGLFAVGGLLLVALCALVALAVGRPGLGARGRLAFYALSVASLVAMGLAVFYVSPAVAPTVAKAVAAAAVLVLVVAFWRNGDREQVFLSNGLVRLGQVALLLPWLLSPWVLASALAPWRLPDAVARPEGASVRPDAPRRIVLVTFDALRHRSTAFADPAARTPALAALGAESHVFTAAKAAGDRTQVSLATLLTGLPPQAIFPHATSPVGYLREGTATGLAGHLAPAGYRATYASMLLSPGVFGLESEFAQGSVRSAFLAGNPINGAEFLPFGRVASWLLRGVPAKPAETGSGNTLLDTRASFETALAGLRSPERTFTWVHVGVPHLPYYDVPAADLGGELHPERYTKVTEADFNYRRYEPGRLEQFERAYEATTAFADAELGRFIAALKQEGLWEETMLVVTSDHGEEFEGWPFAHGKGMLNEDVAHVPLLVHLPGQTAGGRSDEVVGHLDVVPTVLAAVYGSQAPRLPGRDITRPGPVDRVVYSWGMFERYAKREGGAHTVAAYQGRFKLLKEVFPGRYDRLADLKADPLGRRDVAAAHPEVAAALRERVKRDLGLD